MPRTKKPETIEFAPLRKFERRFVVVAVAEDATHCSVICPLFAPPGICQNGILQYDEPKTNASTRKFFRTNDCIAEERNGVEPQM